MFRMSRKDRRIANQKVMIEHRDELIADLQTKIDRLNEEHKIIIKENETGNKAITILEEVYKLTICNKYNNEEVIFNKIKELVDDYQSIN